MRRVLAWLAWAACLLVLWLLFVGNDHSVEQVAGLVAAALGATAAEVVRSQRLLRFRVEWRVVRRSAKHLLRVIPDFWYVLAALPRRGGGEFHTLAFPAGGERDVDAGRRAFAALVASLGPNRLVVDVDPDREEVLVHDLDRARAAKELF